MVAVPRIEAVESVENVIDGLGSLDLDELKRTLLDRALHQDKPLADMHHRGATAGAGETSLIATPVLMNQPAMTHLKLDDPVGQRAGLVGDGVHQVLDEIFVQSPNIHVLSSLAFSQCWDADYHKITILSIVYAR